MNHFFSIALSGGVWLGIGIFLLNLGLNLVVGGNAQGAYTPLLGVLASLFGSQSSAAIVIIVAALFLGYYKAKAVFSRVVKKGVDRILALKEPISITQIYGLKYLMLIAIMMGIGMGMRFFSVPPDIRGLIDIAVGAALINGGLGYLRSAFAVRKNASE